MRRRHLCCSRHHRARCCAARQQRKLTDFFFAQSRLDTNSSANDPFNTKLGDYWLKAMLNNDGTDTVLPTLTANLKETSGTFSKEMGFNQADALNDAIKVEDNICTQ